MIEVAVKTQWQGKVAIRGHYVFEAIKNQEGITIIHDMSSMTIPYAQLGEKLCAVSEVTFKDQFRRFPKERLFYFEWKPDAVQTKLEV